MELTGLAGVSAAAFLFIGSVKVLGVPRGMLAYQEEHFFSKFGIGRTGVRLIGLAEWVGAGLLLSYVVLGWVPGISGAAVHVLVTVGAVMSHLRYGSAVDAIFAVTMFGLSVCVLGAFYLTTL